MKMTLNNIEKSRLTKYLLDNINSFNNRTSEDIARECNEELNFKRKDGKVIILNAHHVNAYHEIFTQNGWEVWTKSELKETFTKLEIVVDKLSERVHSMEIRHDHLIATLSERVFSLEAKRDCTEEVAFATNKSKGEAMNNLFREDN